jgi:transposase
MTEREAALEAELNASRLEVKLLNEKVDALARMVFGKKSEKMGSFDPNQLTLLQESESKKDEAPASDDEPKAGAQRPNRKRRAKPSRPRVPDHLAVEEVVIDPEEVKACPEQWRYIGEEVTEQCDYRPAQFLNLRQIRRKFVKLEEPFAPPVIAPLPPSLQERCLATPGLIAQVVAGKYADHSPLYRQEQIYSRRYGVDIPRQTLCRWTALAADTLEPLYKLMVDQQQRHPYLQIDETPIRYLEPGLGIAPQGYFWVTNIPAGDTIYHWHAGRGADRLHQIIGTHFEGTLQCDGYRAYTSFQKQRAGPIELAACWAHARRKFIEADERDPLVCRWMLRQIAQLYRIEAHLRQQNAGPALRLAVRNSESASILRRIKKALFMLKPRYLPKSNMGKAINYAMEQWDGLEPYAYIRHLLQALPSTTNWNLHKLAPATPAKSQTKVAA